MATSFIDPKTVYFSTGHGWTAYDSYAHIFVEISELDAKELNPVEYERGLFIKANLESQIEQPLFPEIEII